MRPIGLFDSGVGGLSIWRAVVARLPAEATLYVADTAHCPYGSRPAEEVVRLSLGIADFLHRQQAKLIVVACNTASAAALPSLRAKFSLPIVGLEPAVKPAALATRTGHIGVLATAGTVQGALFQQTAQRYTAGVQLHVAVAHDLVELVERGQLNGPQVEARLRVHLEPFLAAQVDQVVLGCTHYPFLIPAMQAILGPDVSIINPATAVARQVAWRLQAHNLAETASTGPPRHQFYATARPAELRSFVERFDSRPADFGSVGWVRNELLVRPDLSNL